MEKRDKPVPEHKLTLVKELVKQMKGHRTILIASCRGLPSSQFHAIKKQMRGTAEVIMVKKNIALRAIDAVGKASLDDLKPQLTSNFVFFFSKEDPFMLSATLTDNQVSSKARAGDIAPEDIEIQPGPTDLVPGPAISELSGVGLKVAVKEGKLEIIKGAIVVKKGEAVKENVAGVLGKLGVAPMKVGFIPLAAYDSQDDKVYVGITIDKEAAVNELRDSIRRAIGFAVSRDYITTETVKYMIAKASAQESAISRLVSAHSPQAEAPQTDTSTKEGA